MLLEEVCASPRGANKRPINDRPDPPVQRETTHLWQNAADVFEAMDTDRSGTISMDELQRMIMRQGYSAEVAKLLMYELDTNLDGEISWEELRTGLAECSFQPARKKVDTARYWRRLAMVSVYFAFGVVVYGLVEGWAPLDTSYFLMVTSTTVGYGDLAPSTRVGKLFTCVYTLVGMTLIIDSLAPFVDFLSARINDVEEAVTRCLERHALIPKAVDTLDMSLTVKQVNATINYTRRYALALSNPLVILLVGVALGHFLVVGTGDWVDELYWAIISMTTIGYGDLTPASPLAKALVMLYLPISVAALAQALTDLNAISLRRSIRETDYGESLAGDFLRAECNRHRSHEESITEAEFLVAVLLRREIVDEITLAAVRRQFRELVREPDDEQAAVPLEERVFNSRRLFAEKVKRGQVRQRPLGVARGTRTGGGKVALTDLAAADGGFAEWTRHHWEPLIAAGLPVRPTAPPPSRGLAAWRVKILGTRFGGGGGNGGAAAAPPLI